MDAWTLFVSLDMDGDHTVSVEDRPARPRLHFRPEQNLGRRKLEPSVSLVPVTTWFGSLVNTSSWVTSEGVHGAVHAAPRSCPIGRPAARPKYIRTI